MWADNIYFTDVVKNGAQMAGQVPGQIGEVGTVRATISFPAQHYAELEKLAQSRRVSLAWVVRDAVEKYLADQWPLLESRPGREE